MPRTLIALLTLILLLSACGPTQTPPAPTQAASPTRAESTPTPIPPTATATSVPTPTFTPEPLRTASFVEITDLVELRLHSAEAFNPVAPGAQMRVGDEARANDSGKARLDLLPDGSIVRLAPNSNFILADLKGDETDPYTLLDLLFGKIFIILNGGSLEVETPSGVAAVRGSMMSVSYDPDADTMTATCLEGHCSLRNDRGVIDLIEGQAADIRNGVLSSAPRPLTDSELLDWINFVPEVERVADRFPRLRDLRDKIRNVPPRRWP